MKSLGIAGYYPVQLHRTRCGAECLHNHLKPNVLYRLLGAGVHCFTLFFLSICYIVSVCRALRQAYSLASFGLCVGFLSDLPMCMTAKGGLS